jgi:hypothetical protein
VRNVVTTGTISFFPHEFADSALLVNSSEIITGAIKNQSMEALPI